MAMRQGDQVFSIVHGYTVQGARVAYMCVRSGRGVIARFIIDHLLAPAFLLDALLVAREPLFDFLLQSGRLGSILSFSGSAKNHAPVQPSALPTAKTLRNNQHSQKYC